jgi:hypothetical protein
MVRSRQGAFTVFDVPPTQGALAFGNNDHGQVTGWFGDATGTHGFVATPVH